MLTRSMNFAVSLSAAFCAAVFGVFAGAGEPGSAASTLEVLGSVPRVSPEPKVDVMRLAPL